MPSTHYGIEIHHSLMLLRLKILLTPTKTFMASVEFTLPLTGKEQVAYGILLNVKIKLLMTPA